MEIMASVLSLLDADLGTRWRRIERVACALAVVCALRVLYNTGSKGALNAVFDVAKALPGVEAAVRAELEKEKDKIERNLLGDGDPNAVTEIPAEGVDARVILERADKFVAEQGGFASGKKWGGIYYRNEGLAELQAALWKKFACTNLLYPAVFPGVRCFEAELVSMVTTMVHGGCGLLTSGGTESILIAVLAYREQARRRGIAHPEIICGVSAHPAVMKACHYFGLTLVKAPICPKTLKMTTALTEPCITKNTIAIYASAPTFTHGVVDPIAELGVLAQARGVGLHVDNCLGGFLLSYLSKEGLYAKPWDFRVPGVTTMSVDIHKYGFASKGVSTTIFRDRALRQLSYVPSSDGCEGLYVTPTLQGSRGGAIVAAAWGTVVSLGDNGYRRAAQRLNHVKDEYIRVVESIPELALLTPPDCAIVPVRSTVAWLNIYLLSSLLEKRGWNMFTGQHPPVMSVCVGEQQTPEIIAAWGRDVRDCITLIEANPSQKVEGTAAVYGAASSTPTELLHDVMCSYVDATLTAKKKR